MKRENSLITRFIPLLLIFLVFTAMITSSVAARYFIKTDDVTNTFTPAPSVELVIEEEFDEEVKSQVYIRVKEDKGYPVYVRVAIVFTWQRKEGDDIIVHYQKPEVGTDYVIDLNLYDGWSLRPEDGYYYFKPELQSGTEMKTTVLIESCKPVAGQAPEGYTLSVEIIAQAVQAVGRTDDDSKDAWEDAWGL